MSRPRSKPVGRVSDEIGPNDVRGMLHNAIQDAGSLRAAATRFKVSAAYLSDVMLHRRQPGAKLAKALGYSVLVIRTTQHVYKPIPKDPR